MEGLGHTFQNGTGANLIADTAQVSDESVDVSEYCGDLHDTRFCRRLRLYRPGAEVGLNDHVAGRVLAEHRQVHCAIAREPCLPKMKLSAVGWADWKTIEASCELRQLIGPSIESDLAREVLARSRNDNLLQVRVRPYYSDLDGGRTAVHTGPNV